MKDAAQPAQPARPAAAGALAPGAMTPPGAKPGAIRAALDKPPTQHGACTSYPNCETVDNGAPCYHFAHACTIRQDEARRAAALSELTALEECAEALKYLSVTIRLEPRIVTVTPHKDGKGQTTGYLTVPIGNALSEAAAALARLGQAAETERT